MAEREIKRNGRGQIVSYEIAGVNDPTILTDEYGKVLLSTNGQGGTYTTKYNAASFTSEINTDFSTEFIPQPQVIDPQIILNEIITPSDQRATGIGAGGQGGGSLGGGNVSP